MTTQVDGRHAEYKVVTSSLVFNEAFERELQSEDGLLGTDAGDRATAAFDGSGLDVDATTNRERLTVTLADGAVVLVACLRPSLRFQPGEPLPTASLDLQSNVSQFFLDSPALSSALAGVQNMGLLRLGLQGARPAASAIFEELLADSAAGTTYFLNTIRVRTRLRSDLVAGTFGPVNADPLTHCVGFSLPGAANDVAWVDSLVNEVEVPAPNANGASVETFPDNSPGILAPLQLLCAVLRAFRMGVFEDQPADFWEGMVWLADATNGFADAVEEVATYSEEGAFGALVQLMYGHEVLGTVGTDLRGRMLDTWDDTDHADSRVSVPDNFVPVSQPQLWIPAPLMEAVEEVLHFLLHEFWETGLLRADVLIADQAWAQTNLPTIAPADLPAALALLQVLGGDIQQALRSLMYAAVGADHEVVVPATWQFAEGEGAIAHLVVGYRTLYCNVLYRLVDGTAPAEWNQSLAETYPLPPSVDADTTAYLGSEIHVAVVNNAQLELAWYWMVSVGALNLGFVQRVVQLNQGAINPLTAWAVWVAVASTSGSVGISDGFALTAPGKTFDPTGWLGNLEGVVKLTSKAVVLAGALEELPDSYGVLLSDFETSLMVEGGGIPLRTDFKLSGTKALNLTGLNLAIGGAIVLLFGPELLPAAIVISIWGPSVVLDVALDIGNALGWVKEVGGIDIDALNKFYEEGTEVKCSGQFTYYQMCGRLRALSRISMDDSSWALLREAAVDAADALLPLVTGEVRALQPHNFEEDLVLATRAAVGSWAGGPQEFAIAGTRFLRASGLRLSFELTHVDGTVVVLDDADSEFTVLGLNPNGALVEKTKKRGELQFFVASDNLIVGFVPYNVSTAIDTIIGFEDDWTVTRIGVQFRPVGDDKWGNPTTVWADVELQQEVDGEVGFTSEDFLEAEFANIPEGQWGLIAGTPFRAMAPGTFQNIVFPFWSRPQRPRWVPVLDDGPPIVCDYDPVTSAITPEASRALLALGGLNLAASGATRHFGIFEAAPGISQPPGVADGFIVVSAQSPSLTSFRQAWTCGRRPYASIDNSALLLAESWLPVGSKIEEEPTLDAEEMLRLDRGSGLPSGTCLIIRNSVPGGQAWAKLQCTPSLRFATTDQHLTLPYAGSYIHLPRVAPDIGCPESQLTTVKFCLSAMVAFSQPALCLPLLASFPIDVFHPADKPFIIDVWGASKWEWPQLEYTNLGHCEYWLAPAAPWNLGGLPLQFSWFVETAGGLLQLPNSMGLNVPADIALVGPGATKTLRVLPVPTNPPAGAPAGLGLILVSNLTGSEDFKCTLACVAQVGQPGDFIGAETVTLKFNGTEKVGSLLPTSFLTGLFKHFRPVIPEETVREFLDLPAELSHETGEPKALSLLPREEVMKQNLAGKQYECTDGCTAQQFALQAALSEREELEDLLRALVKKRQDGH